MTQVIVYTNATGNVSICIPTGEIPIETVLTKDCPEGAIIVDDDTLPQGIDAQFSDAWVLNGSTISIDMTKAKAITNVNLNNIAKKEANHRLTNTSIGLPNVLSDADWLALLTTARTNITNANTTQNLVDALVPVETAIINNKT
jgi:hypothetical protein